MINDITDIYLNRKDNKGIGIVTTKSLNIGDIPINDTSIVSIPIGKERRRICYCCYSIISKIKIRDDCKLISFCSLSCMEKSRWFLDQCGGLCQLILDSNHIDNNNNSLILESKEENIKLYKNSFSDSQLLCVSLLYNLHSFSEDRRYLEIQRLLSHPTHVDAIDTKDKEAAWWLYNHIMNLSPSILNIYNKLDISLIELIQLLLRVIQYNAQPISISELPATSILTFLPTLSLLNHSCVPNVILSHVIDTQPVQSGKSSQVIVFIRVINPIAIGDEITISYLSNLCSSRHTRNVMLSSAFKFYCNCQRCQNEIDQESLIKINQEDLIINKLNKLIINKSLTTIEGLNIMINILDQNNLSYSNCHDFAMLILQSSLQFKKQIKNNNSFEILLNINLLIIRSCYIIINIWKIINCSNHPQRIDYMLQMGVAGVALQGFNNNLSINLSSDIKKYYSLLVFNSIELTKESINILNNLSNNNNNNKIELENNNRITIPSLKLLEKAKTLLNSFG